MARSACDLSEAGYKHTGQCYRVAEEGFREATVHNYFGDTESRSFSTERRSLGGAEDLPQLVYLHVTNHHWGLRLGCAMRATENPVGM